MSGGGYDTWYCHVCGERHTRPTDFCPEREQQISSEAIVDLERRVASLEHRGGLLAVLLRKLMSSRE